MSAEPLRICSAHAECQVHTCRHKVAHVCEDKCMHHHSTCYDSKLNSACIAIVDGKIPQSRWKKCDCCGHSERVTDMVPIEPQTA